MEWWNRSVSSWRHYSPSQWVKEISFTTLICLTSFSFFTNIIFTGYSVSYRELPFSDLDEKVALKRLESELASFFPPRFSVDSRIMRITFSGSQCYLWNSQIWVKCNGQKWDIKIIISLNFFDHLFFFSVNFRHFKWILPFSIEMPFLSPFTCLCVCFSLILYFYSNSPLALELSNLF